MQQWDNPNGFIKGVEINDEQLGKIKLSFTSTRPLQFELTIKGKTYKPNKEGKQRVDLSGVISVFWTLMAFTVLVLMYTYTIFFMYDVKFLLFVSLYLTFITGVYAGTAVLISKGKYWAFYIGSAYLLFSTAYYTWVGLVAPDVTGLLMICFVRILILVYLIISIRKLSFAMQIASIDDKKDEVLDDNL